MTTYHEQVRPQGDSPAAPPHAQDGIDWSDLDETVQPDPAEDASSLFKPGGSFFLDVPENPSAVWGAGGDVLWAEGEALLISAPQGVGKTTMANQLIRARMGLQDTVLGYPVVPGSVVLLLAMDRPAQARRAGHRIFKDDDPAYLNEHLVVWEGPPPFDLAKQTDILVAMCEKAKADTVVVDSLKDAAVGLSEDAVGAGWNRARQKALAAGVQVLELHHNRKAGANGGEPNTLSDVYGSVWIPSGAGSVISLWGEAGDPVVKLRHLKQPMNEVGPFNIVHDHERGTTSVEEGVDLYELVRRSGPDGLTPLKAAEALFEAKAPTRAQKEKARRKLDKAVDEGRLTRMEPFYKGGSVSYYLVERGQS